MNANYKNRVLKYLKEIIGSLGITTMIVLAATTSLSGQYPLLPIPTAYRSPSGEEGQILLDGLVKKVSLFHGESDDEADWHVYIRLHQDVKNRLTRFLKAADKRINYPFDEIYSEIMVLDKYKNSTFNEKFYAADVTKALRLSKRGSNHPAWDFGVYATEHQGDEKNYIDNSLLNGGRVYLQGAFVNDKAHEKKINGVTISIERVEIHPLDGMAFAMDEDGSVYSAKYGEAGWAQSFVRWRVAFFANSTYHRINRESYLKKDRVTTFYLDLPNNYYNNSSKVKVDTKIEMERQKLWDGRTNREYLGKGLRSLAQHSIITDEKDGRKKLKVTATMKKPNAMGGIVVIDYIVRVTLNQQAVR
jgi:hypothetical protein